MNDEEVFRKATRIGLLVLSMVFGLLGIVVLAFIDSSSKTGMTLIGISIVTVISTMTIYTKNVKLVKTLVPDRIEFSAMNKAFGSECDIDGSAYWLISANIYRNNRGLQIAGGQKNIRKALVLKSKDGNKEMVLMFDGVSLQQDTDYSKIRQCKISFINTETKKATIVKLLPGSIYHFDKQGTPLKVTDQGFLNIESMGSFWDSVIGV